MKAARDPLPIFSGSWMRSPGTALKTLPFLVSEEEMLEVWDSALLVSPLGASTFRPAKEKRVRQVVPES